MLASGSHSLNIFSDRIYKTAKGLEIKLGWYTNVALAAFVTKRVKDSVPGVSGDTWMTRWNKDSTETFYDARETREMEGEFSGFDNYLRDYWLSRGVPQN